MMFSVALAPAAFSAQGGGGDPAGEESPFAFRAVSGNAGGGGEGAATTNNAGDGKAAFDPTDKLNQPPDFVVDWDAGKIRPVGRQGWWRGGGNAPGAGEQGKAAFDPTDKLNQPPDFVVDWDAGKIRPVARQGWWRGGGNDTPSTDNEAVLPTESALDTPAFSGGSLYGMDVLAPERTGP